MAKKKTKKPAKAGTRKPAKGSKPPKGPRTRAAGPRSQVLPGMEQVRNRKLDTLCEAIGESRDAINQATTDVTADSQLALQTMQKDGLTHYTHRGVELILRKGADKLSVKLLKDKTAEGTAAPESAASKGAASDVDADYDPSGDIADVSDGAEIV